MPSKKVIRKTVCLVILVLFLVGCGASEAETTLQLTFDGESCTYEGPTTLKAGLVTLLFLNESDGWAGTNLVMPLGDKTLQDLIDLFGEEPSQQHAPSWSFSIPGVWKEINAGEEIIKYGESIGRAKVTIPLGYHVHIHNVESNRGRGDTEK